LRFVQIKFGKQRKSHFSRPSAIEAIIPRETLGNGDRMAMPSQIHRARSKIANRLDTSGMLPWMILCKKKKEKI